MDLQHTQCKPWKVITALPLIVLLFILTPILGFFRSIALRNENALQDTLRLLTLWFKFGDHEDVSYAMASGFSTVEVDTWLEVIPQVSLLLFTDFGPTQCLLRRSSLE